MRRWGKGANLTTSNRPRDRGRGVVFIRKREEGNRPRSLVEGVLLCKRIKGKKRKGAGPVWETNCAGRECGGGASDLYYIPSLLLLNCCLDARSSLAMRGSGQCLTFPSRQDPSLMLPNYCFVSPFPDHGSHPLLLGVLLPLLQLPVIKPFTPTTAPKLKLGKSTTMSSPSFRSPYIRGMMYVVIAVLVVVTILGGRPVGATTTTTTTSTDVLAPAVATADTLTTRPEGPPDDPSSYLLVGTVVSW